MGQRKTPDEIQWVSDANEPTAVANPGAIIDTGWTSKFIPPPQFANWFPNLAAKWINYFAGFFLSQSDAYVLSGLQVVQTAAVGFRPDFVAVEFGEAVADGILVEVPEPSNESLAMPQTAGTASNVDAFLVRIDSTGTLSVASYGTFLTRDAAIAQIPNLGTAQAALAVVFDEPGITAYDTAQILDVRQLRPISANVIASQSITHDRLTIPPIATSVPGSASGPATQRYFDLDLNTFDPGVNWPLSNVPKLAAIRVQVEVFRDAAAGVPGDYNPPLPAASVEKYREMEEVDALHVGVMLTTVSGGAPVAVIPTLGGADIAESRWAGDIDPTEGPPRVYLLRRAGIPTANNYRVRISTEYGPAKEYQIVLPAT